MRKVNYIPPPKPVIKKVKTKPSLYELEKIKKKEDLIEAKLREIMPG